MILTHLLLREIMLYSNLIVFAFLAAVGARIIEPGRDDEKYKLLLSFDAPPTLDWWEAASYYHVYPRSFKDSDGDGFGDLKGITSKMQHFKNSGIDAIWMSPIFVSPGVDQGYDISDYRAIDKMFGTMDDLRDLLDEAHKLGIKVILDFVPNHTSDEHEWFKLSENRTKGYEDYYVWVDGVPGKYPNNWISVFKGHAWKWSEKRQQYYLHQFHYKQPDLNLENPKVIEELKDILTFYLDMGVDGFRVDAVPYLREDLQLRDNPVAPGHVYDVNDIFSVDTIYTKDFETTFEVVYQFREHVDAYTKAHNTETKLLITEAYAYPDKLMLYLGTPDGSRLGAHFTFNFYFVLFLKGTNFTVQDLNTTIALWANNIPSIYTSNWLLGNHDNPRVGDRYGQEKADGLTMLVTFLPGTYNTYYGEEIAMMDGMVTCEQGWDPVAIKNCSTYAENTRDYERTPFQWDGSKNAGFSDSNHTWLPVAGDYKENNLALQDVEGIESHYNLFKELMNFRQQFKTPSAKDTFKLYAVSEKVVQIHRKRDATDYAYVFNFGTEEMSLDLIGAAEYEVLVTTPKSSYKKGDKLHDLALKPYECLILRGTKKL